jgi:hypothetical protein
MKTQLTNKETFKNNFKYKDFWCPYHQTFQSGELCPENVHACLRVISGDAIKVALDYAKGNAKAEDVRRTETAESKT